MEVTVLALSGWQGYREEEIGQVIIGLNNLGSLEPTSAGPSVSCQVGDEPTITTDVILIPPSDPKTA